MNNKIFAFYSKADDPQMRGDFWSRDRHMTVSPGH